MTKRTIHPILRLDYVVRLLGAPLGALLVAASRWNEPNPPLLWVLLAVYALVWPHVAYFTARSRPDSRAAEHVNLLIDCTLFGIATALVSFRPLPSTLLVTGILTSTASVGGWQLFARGTLALLLAALTTGWLVTEFRATLETSLLATGIAVIGIFLYQLLLAIQTYYQARRFVSSRRQVEAQAEQIRRQNAELDEALQTQTATSEALRLINRVTVVDVDAVLENLVSSAVRVCGADQCVLYLFDGEVLRMAAVHGGDESFRARLKALAIEPGHGSAAARCALGRRPVHVEDILADPEYEAGWQQSGDGFRTVLCVQMLQGDALVGIIAVVRQVPRAFTERQIDVLALFADQAVIALEKARLFRELQRASEHKSQFLANMSHELRTPLNAIIGFSEMLLESAQSRGANDQIRPLERVLRAAHHLLALISDILDLSRIEAGKMELHVEAVPLGPLIADVVATAQPLAEKNGSHIVLESSEDVGAIQADAMRLKQVLLNLISNACKFTERGTVTLRVSRAPDADGTECVQFAIRDTGIGMSPEQLSRLFQDFTQADQSTTRKYGGTGLGLAISRRLCRMMGGDIEVTSTVGEGSTFTVTMPVGGALPQAESTTAGAQAGAVPEAESATTAGSTILVVDDDPAVRELLEHHLTRSGYTVAVARNGVEAIARARELRPAAITLEVLMPDLDGWSVLGALKSDPQTASTPVILVSIIEEKKRGYALGAAEYLVKPADRSRLLEALRGLGVHPAGRVLVIEDDDDTREVQRQALEHAGWTVDEAADGRAGLDRLADARPDAIVLDLMMPVMDGFEFLATLRASPDWREIPVLVYTARELTPDDQRRLAGEAQEVLRKAGDNRDQLMQELVRLVETATGRRTDGPSLQEPGR
ncbi:MAG: response regulator [Burkholderiales bacterium]|nr:MAG: response regulator [Burkholderiales bacterium]